MLRNSMTKIVILLLEIIKVITKMYICSDNIYYVADFERQ